MAVSVEYKYDSAFPQSKRELVINGIPDASLTVTVAQVEEFFDDGYTIVDDFSGRLYRILEVNRSTGALVLTEDWRWRGYDSDPLNPPASQMGLIWVVPPAVNSDRYPCVGVYQKIIRFDEIN